jgi:hypothetical protein
VPIHRSLIGSLKAKRTPSPIPEYIRSPDIIQSAQFVRSPEYLCSPEFLRSPKFLRSPGNQHLLWPDFQSPTNPEYLRSGTPTSVQFGLHSVKKVPDLEREVDVLVDTGEAVDPEEIYEQVRPPIEEIHPLFSLPARLRQKIYGCCFEVETDGCNLGEETKTITLSPRFATKAVFEDGFFASPWDVLEPVMGALRSSHILRHDLLAYFWSQYHFHVTLSMFSGPKFSPLSHLWLPHYLDVIQYLTIEVDLTRLGGSAMTQAPSFGHNVQKLELLLCKIIHGISTRGGSSQCMAELKLLCRRYAGFRPFGEFNNDSERTCSSQAAVIRLQESYMSFRMTQMSAYI